MTFTDDDYPLYAKEIMDMPILLYYKGNPHINPPGIGIVGSRRCTEYGKELAREAGEYLAQHQIPVISGMAKGNAGIECPSAGQRRMGEFIESLMCMGCWGIHLLLSTRIVFAKFLANSYHTRPICSQFVHGTRYRRNFLRHQQKTA